MTNRENLREFNSTSLAYELITWFGKNVIPLTPNEFDEALRDLWLWLDTDCAEPKAFTEYELIKAFRDKFLERRAIGILEIEELIKELYQ